MRLLVLTVSYPNDVSFVWDWMEAFKSHRTVTSIIHDIGTSGGKRRLPRLMREVDAIVALHGTTTDWLADLNEVTPVLLDRRVPLVVFVGNEYNCPFPWLAEKIAAVKALRGEIVVSQLLQETAEWLYAETGARALSLPHALNSRRYFPGPDHAVRRLDLASRSFRYPPYVGDSERNDILSAAAQLGRRSSLVIDVNLKHRLPPERWANLLTNSRATVSTEAGSWYLERDDHTARRVEDLMRRTGNSGFRLPASLRRCVRRLPTGAKEFLRRIHAKLPITYAPLTYPDEETSKSIAAIYSRASKSPVYGKCASGRHFDALGTRTLQLLTPGRYNDILKPGEHYLEIAADGSNLREMIEVARDPAIWARITEAGLALGLASTHSVRIDRLVAELHSPGKDYPMKDL